MTLDSLPAPLVELQTQLAADPLLSLVLLLAVVALLGMFALLGKLRKQSKQVVTYHAELPSFVEADREALSTLPEKVAALPPELIEQPIELSESLAELSDVAGETESAPDLRGGLTKTRSHFFGRIRRLFSGKPAFNESFLQELEEVLVTSDIGIATTSAILEKLRSHLDQGTELTDEGLQRLLHRELVEILSDKNNPALLPAKVGGMPKVILMVGVNGVGKTTTIGKLAQRFTADGAKVMLAACDTFRAGAVHQLQVWAERTGASFVGAEEGAKPSTVAYQAIHRAKAEGVDILLIDTAGRLHTRVNLMNELEGVIEIIAREQPGAPHEIILVVDGSTGQNALQQAKEFNQRKTLSGIIITKLDGTPKGGIVVAIRRELGTPIRYIGIGESANDLRIFNAEAFVDALFTGDIVQGEEINEPSAHGKVRRRRREVANGG